MTAMRPPLRHFTFKKTDNLFADQTACADKP